MHGRKRPVGAAVKLWPWKRSEARATNGDADGAVSEALIQAALQHGGSGSGGADSPTDLAIVEACAGLWARGFGSAAVSPDVPATMPLTAPVLAAVGRDLCTVGDSVWLLDVGDGVALHRASTYDVHGQPLANRLRYRLDIAGPDGVATRNVQAESVLHFRYGSTPNAPWRGRSPLWFGGSTRALAARVEQSLRAEFKLPSGLVVFAGRDWASGVGDPALPEDPEGEGPGESALKALADASAAKQGILWYGDGGEIRDGPPVTERIGPRPPAEVADVRRDVADSILGACGVPPVLLRGVAGAAMREGWRQFLHGTLSPVARLVEAECRAKLDADVRLSFERLHASDLAGRARAYKQLIEAGLDAGQAGAVAGIEAAAG